MRPQSESLKQSLRFLAAARYYLPMHLQSPSQWEEQYQEYLHHMEYELALEALEAIGEAQPSYAEESLFWQELLLASQQMGLHEHATRNAEKLKEVLSKA